jgi:hypothetical protein
MAKRSHWPIGLASFSSLDLLAFPPLIHRGILIKIKVRGMGSELEEVSWGKAAMEAGIEWRN